MNARLNQTITLSDGRSLGFAEYGDPDGFVVFFMHGQPGNRLFHPDSSITKSAGIRLIIPDRPGYGLSANAPGRKLADWPGDLIQLADSLAVEQFGLIGFSAGGPYALVCAAVYPEKIRQLLLISSAPPLSDRNLLAKMPLLVRLNYWTLRLLPRFFYLTFEWYWSRARKNPMSFIHLTERQSSLADQKILKEPQVQEMILSCWEENLRVESTGYVRDAEILFGEWGFDLSEIETTVLLWWGDQDRNTPTAVRDFYESQLSNTRLYRQPELGHFGFLTAWAGICQRVHPQSIREQK